MNTPVAEFYPGSLVSARGREWIVLPESTTDTLRLRPLGGGEKDESLIYLPLELQPVGPATFPWPVVAQARNHSASQLLMDALQLKLRSGAGPFRSFGNIAVEPRAYQLVPLLMAMKQPTVRLLIADDVGIGKTIEGALIAREMLDRGEIHRMAVLCPPHLCEQWQRELEDRFHIQAVVVRSSSATRLERDLPPGAGGYSGGQGGGYNAGSQSGAWSPSQGKGKKWEKGWGRDRQPANRFDAASRGPRGAPATKTDQAARLLMAHMEFMEELTHEDFDALARCGAPHGHLFSWLEAQFQEYGAQPWAVLRERLQECVDAGVAQLAERLMTGPHAQPEGELPELRRELRGVLNRVLIDHLKQQTHTVAMAISTDPHAAQQLRDIYSRLQFLENETRNPS